MNLDQALELARELGREAGAMAMAAFGRAKPVVKASADGRDLVTQADKDIEAMLVERIFEAYPNHQILGEEGGAVCRVPDPEPVTWVLDPIDGTFNFAAGMPLFGVCIGVCVGGRPAAGVIEMPALGESYWAVRGGGAFCNGERIEVDHAATMATAHIDTCGRDLYRLYAKLAQAGFDRRLPRLTGCVATACAFVAAGRMGALVHTSINPWDLAAGQAIVEEAGGVCCDFAGGPLFPKYLDLYLQGAGDKFCCLVTTPELRRPLFELVKGVSPQALGGA